MPDMGITWAGTIRMLDTGVPNGRTGDSGVPDVVTTPPPLPGPVVVQTERAAWRAAGTERSGGLSTLARFVRRDCLRTRRQVGGAVAHAERTEPMRRHHGTEIVNLLGHQG